MPPPDDQQTQNPVSLRKAQYRASGVERLVSLDNNQLIIESLESCILGGLNTIYDLIDEIVERSNSTCGDTTPGVSVINNQPPSINMPITSFASPSDGSRVDRQMDENSHVTSCIRSVLSTTPFGLDAVPEEEVAEWSEGVDIKSLGKFTVDPSSEMDF
eukprot:GHVH01008112.1.p1 GENE.GHVH01008112.1~~GHVH01008112.1.p1  ORF type:complete len:159 (+),score=22.80 GHVH01008112.1:151-627(+)